MSKEAPSFPMKDATPRQEWIGDRPDLTAKDKAYSRFNVDGKNAVITGGGRGMGLDAAYALLEHGADGVLLLDLNEDNLATAQTQLQRLYPDRTVCIKKLNVASAEQTQDAVQYASSVLNSVDIVLCFAGIVNCKHVEDHSPSEWNRVMDINSTGSFYTAKYFGEYMARNKFTGAIVLIASIAGHGGLYPQPQIAYNTSKAAVIGMMKSFATEWAQHGIRVNSISPGFMDTALNAGEGLDVHREVWYERMPMARLGERGALNGTIMLLASQAGSYITGSDILVDGGICSCIV